MPKKLTLRLTGFIALFILSHFSHHLLTALVVPMLPFIRDTFTLSYTAVGLVASAFSFANGIGQLPAGWLADHYGARNMLTLGIAGVALAGACIGMSSGIFWLVLFLVIMGLAAGGYHPSAPPLIIKAVGAENRGRALGFHVIGGSLSHFLSPVIGISLAMAWGWRGAFLGTSLPVFLFGIFFFFLLGKIGVGLVNQKRGDVKVAGDGSDLPDAPAVLHIHSEHLNVDRTRKILRITAFLTLTCVANAFIQASITFIPMIMIDFFSAGENSAAFTLSLIYSAGFWAAPLSGFVSDRIGRVPVLIVLAVILIPVLGLVTLVPYGPFTYLLMLGFGITLFSRMPASEAFIYENVEENRRSTVLGIYYAGGIGGGALLTPLLGRMADSMGFRQAFGYTTLIYTVLVIVLVVMLGIFRDRSVTNPGD